MVQEDTTQLLKEELDVLGWFWLASQPDYKMPGHLRFNPEDGATLELIARKAAEQMSWMFGEDQEEEGVTILGEMPTGQKFVLLQCLRFGAVYKSPIVLQGRQFEESHLSAGFKAASLTLRHLAYWVDKSKIEQERDSNGDTILRMRAGETIKTPAAFGELTLKILPECSLEQPGPAKSYTVRDSCTFFLHFSELQSIENIGQWCRDLQNLVTIGVEALAMISRAHVTHESTPVRLYKHWLGADIPNSAPKMLFSYDDIGGLDGVAKWLRVSEKYRHVIERLTSKWVMPSSFVNYRFNDAYIAVETLLRIRLGREPSMKKDIICLAKGAGDAFKFLVSDIDTWAQKVVVDTRINREVHTNPQLDSADGSTLQFLAESLYYLVVIHLLKECEIDVEVIESFRDSGRFVWLANGLKRCL